MDGQQFDALARAFGRGISRRAAIKTIAGSVLGGALLANRFDRVNAQGGFAGDYCDDENPCGDGLHCCYGQTTNICADCCGDDQCPLGAVCEEFTCVPVEQCEVAGEYCDGETPCCDGLHCCYGQATNICADCCGDDQCPLGAICQDWTCVPVDSGCANSDDCADGTCCCADGSCSANCCAVNTLPSTGSGQDGVDGAATGVIAVAGAAAALVAAKKLRDDREIVETDEFSR